MQFITLLREQYGSLDLSAERDTHITEEHDWRQKNVNYAATTRAVYLNSGK
jgi:hypothetical protein